ncbi:MAG TPA: hypothetical protein VK601_22385, partial [Kofleriaceae bacterium]|nr:hypothetical protein [Kofleriaceae bacterium]
MSEPTLQPRSRDTAADVETVPRAVPAARAGGARTPDAAWTEVQAILAGRGNAAELVGLVGQLDPAHRVELRDKLTNVSVLTTGDATIEIGEVIGAPLAGVLKEAFQALLGPPSVPRLARYLANAVADDVAAFEPAVVAAVLAKFGRQPMLAVMPKAGADLTG